MTKYSMRPKLTHFEQPLDLFQHAPTIAISSLFAMMMFYLQSLSLPYQYFLTQMESIFHSGAPPNPQQHRPNNTNSNANANANANVNNNANMIRLLHIAIFPAFVLLMAFHHLQTSSLTAKWVHSCSTLLVGAVASYLTLMVLVECVVRVVLLQAGISIQSSTTTTENPNHQCLRKRRTSALDRRIERSLVERNLKVMPTDTNRCNSGCCSSSGTTNGTTEEPLAVVIGESDSCCSICLEDFAPGDVVVSGRRNCCKSNVFHEACIQQWLRIHDSCPCCRQPMLEEEDACNMNRANVPSNAPSFVSEEQEDHPARYLWSQLQMRIDTTVRMRNEILSYYIADSSSGGLHQMGHYNGM